MDAERRQTWAGARDRMLRSHGAVVPPYRGWRQPANFRPDTLIIPPGLVGTDRAAIEAAVRDAGLEIAIRAPAKGAPGCPAVARVWRRRENGVAAASAALDAIHADANLRGVSSDRLLMGCAMVGEGPPTAGHSDPGAGGYPHLWPERGGRIPVTLPEPERLRILDGVGKERPVVAVLDSGLGRNAWLKVDRDGTSADVDFLVTDQAIQDRIRTVMTTHARPARGLPVIRNSRDVTRAGNGRIGEVDSHLGHGTFIAGIMRQRASNALIRMIRVMYSDGIVYESAVVTALWELYERNALAQARLENGEEVDRSQSVDVVSLSFGGFFRDEEEEKQGSPLFRAIDALRSQGVVVVAAAGNAATDDPFYPAAMAGFPDPGLIPVVSVGALNPNGTRAAFSNYGSWVNYRAPGVSIISAMPDDIQGPLSPAYVYRLPNRATAHTLDPDDFSSGYAIWSGTSFATAFAAADVANALTGYMNDGKPLDLSIPGRIERALKALHDLGVLK